MSDNRNCPHPTGNQSRENMAIDCNRILDSCRDKDCFENVRVYLTDCGQNIIDKTSTVRVKCTKVVGTCINVEPVRFNRGFYQVYVRFYTRVLCEACVQQGRAQEFEGIAVCEKRVILYGSEGEVSIFRSDPHNNSFCCSDTYDNETETNAPVAVCEVVDPIALSVCVADERRPCCCRASDIPDNVLSCIDGTIGDDDFDGKRLYCTLGFFSVIRIERPAQVMIQASEYSVPDKQCVEADDEDPCSVFCRMSFPVNKFSSPSICELRED